jgi:hypothetical protein
MKMDIVSLFVYQMTPLTKKFLNLEMLANGSIDGFIMSLSKETQLKAIFTIIPRGHNQGMPAMEKLRQ